MASGLVLNHELSKLFNQLWDADVNRFRPGQDYTISLQGKADFVPQGAHRATDHASQALFLWVNEGRLQSTKTFAAFISLLDNYETSTGIAEVVTPEEEAENNLFLDALLETEVMKLTHQYLVRKNWSKPSRTDFKAQLYRIWFQLYTREGYQGPDSCGFEHVFVGETRRGRDILGFHNWVQFYLQEKRGNIDYKGYVARRHKSRVSGLVVGGVEGLSSSLCLLFFFLPLHPTFCGAFTLLPYHLSIPSFFFLFFSSLFCAPSFLFLHLPPLPTSLFPSLLPSPFLFPHLSYFPFPFLFLSLLSYAPSFLFLHLLPFFLHPSFFLSLLLSSFLISYFPFFLPLLSLLCSFLSLPSSFFLHPYFLLSLLFSSFLISFSLFPFSVSSSPLLCSLFSLPSSSSSFFLHPSLLSLLLFPSFLSPILLLSGSLALPALSLLHRVVPSPLKEYAIPNRFLPKLSLSSPPRLPPPPLWLYLEPRILSPCPFLSFPPDSVEVPPPIGLWGRSSEMLAVKCFANVRTL
ncbi:uncharacterized protein LOC127538460 isoform X1 [Antechinus flavipes]|uniref:uncharacterized protein LOC127538460 isoform X1 n=1 Tax=Antechinus flavipes TaxID=38775 RepID=UPI002235F39C|nr:uncharacterized protein LOC127538460 isoform X1 [Antechinus flavipes]